MCGGMGGVLKVTISRNLVGGENFDLRCNWNLLDPSHKKAFWHYLEREKPKVIVMAPPCTAFNALAQLFKHRQYKKYLKNWSIGVKLANLAAEVAHFQLACGNHFLVENPERSLFWKLKSWVSLVKKIGPAISVIDQCMYG